MNKADVNRKNFDGNNITYLPDKSKYQALEEQAATIRELRRQLAERGAK